MKKALIISAVLLIVLSTSLFSLGIGGAFSMDVVGGLPNSAMLSLKLDKSPAVLGLGLSIRPDLFRIGATADWWLYHQHLAGILSLYMGPGLYLSAGTGVFDFGARIPVGLQAFVIDPLELFVELAPSLGFSGGTFPAWGVQGAFGFRFWF